MQGASFRRNKPLLLLAYLAMTGAQDRRYVSELFWPNAGNPRQSLSVALSTLRGVSPTLVEMRANRISTRVECDALRLRTAAAEGDWRDVLDLYGGPFMMGVDVGAENVELEEWLFGVREEMAARATTAFVEVAEESRSAGDARAVSRLVEAALAAQAGAVEFDPITLRRLHALLVHLGDPRSVAVEDTLAELGFGTTTMGSAGGRDTEAGPRADLDGGPPSDPGLAHRSSVPVVGLPRRLTPFVGRGEELRELKRVLREGARLVTITGLGGMGKTALATELARTLAERSVYDQLLFVSLESTKARVLDRIAVSISGRASVKDPMTIVRAYCAAGRTLLVLDCFEHLVREAPHLEEELLAECPTVTALVTAREPLGLAAERVYPLQGLTVPAPAEGDSDAVRLFTLSARRLDPRFVIDDTNIKHVISLCRHVAGAPLAIELAAALTRVVPLQELLNDVRADLDALVSTAAGVPEKHETVRATFERSWTLLTEPEARALAGLAVFAGGFTRDAARAVLHLDVRSLAALIDKSLVTRQGDRYDLHPLVKQFAREKLIASGKFAALRRAHGELFASFVETRHAFDKAVGESAAMDEIETEYFNVLAAWEWAVSEKDSGLVGRMAPMFGSFLNRRRHPSERDPVLRAAWDAVTPGSTDESRVLRMSARSLLGAGSDAEALTVLKRALDVALVRGDRSEEGCVRYFMGNAYRDSAAAQRSWWEAVRLLEESDEERVLGGCLVNLSTVVSEPVEREQILRRAVAVTRANGSSQHLFAALANLGSHVGSHHGDQGEAAALYREALATGADNDADRDTLIVLRANLAASLTDLGEYAAAEREIGLIREVWEARRPWDSDSLKLVGDGSYQALLLAMARGEIGRARELAATAPKLGPAAIKLALYERRYEEAERLLAEALQRLASASRPWRAGRALASYALIRAESAALRTAGVPAGSVRAEALKSDGLRELLSCLNRLESDPIVPLALDSFYVAYLLAPQVVGEELVELTATEPAATAWGRRRALETLAGRQLDGPTPPPASRTRTPAEEIRTRARELLVRVRESVAPAPTA